MSQHDIPPASSDDPPSARTQISELIADVRALAEAEWDYVKARLSYSGGVARKAGIFAILALLSLFGAAIALILGLLLIIASYWGPIIATLFVVFFFTAITVVSALLARKTANQLRFTESHNDD